VRDAEQRWLRPAAPSQDRADLSAGGSKAVSAGGARLVSIVGSEPSVRPAADASHGRAGRASGSGASRHGRSWSWWLLSSLMLGSMLGAAGLHLLRRLVAGS
jgi:hypothetical protein